MPARAMPPTHAAPTHARPDPCQSSPMPAPTPRPARIAAAASVPYRVGHERASTGTRARANDSH